MEYNLQQAMAKVFVNSMGQYDYSRLTMQEYNLVLDSMQTELYQTPITNNYKG